MLSSENATLNKLSFLMSAPFEGAAEEVELVETTAAPVAPAPEAGCKGAARMHAADGSGSPAAGIS